MNPSLRSRFVERLGAEATRQNWRALVAEHGTPLLILDPAKVTRQCELFARHLPGVQIRYAVKAAPHPAVLDAVAAAGGGFDVATSAEVDLVESLGLGMDRCLHTHPIKKIADIEHAYRAGVRTFVVDNPVEAQKFAGMPADIGILVRLAFRNPAAKSDLSSKFGVEPADAELLVKHVLAAGARFEGFSFHVGSQGAEAHAHGAALRTTMELAAHLRGSLGIDVPTIDIGGGFPVTYREPMPGIDVIGANVGAALGGTHPVRMLAEPGRFLAADAMTLLTTVVGSTIRDGRVWHYLDDGLYGAYSNILTEDVHPPIVALSELAGGRSAALEPVTLAGPTCDSVDVIARDYPMPELSIGDIVASPVMGAYTTVTSSRFNGIPETPIVCVAPSRSAAAARAA
ncbi:MAG TPA: type III PLP-dependent enzyme [Mycobacterium sp.]|nr:type III PLP-dependent enzyme [Mycobacterium sp.]